MGKFVKPKIKETKFDKVSLNENKIILKDNKLVDLKRDDREAYIVENNEISSANKVEELDIEFIPPEVRDDVISINNIVSDHQEFKQKDEKIMDSIQNVVDDYNKAIVDFAHFLEGTPTFVTYYRINKHLSTEDVGLGGVIETVGAESPVKYDKILNFPIWNIEEMAPNLAFDEVMGLDTEMESSGVILPETITPHPDDYLIITMVDRKLLFRVNEIQQSNIKNQCFYKINFDLDTKNSLWIETQVVHVYEYDFNAKCLIDNGLANIESKIQELIDRLTEDYVSNFYDRRFNSFMYDNHYDNYLHRFIKECHVFVKKNSFMYDIHVDQQLLMNISEETKYKNTIFDRISVKRKQLPLFNAVRLPLNKDVQPFSIFNQYRTPISVIEYMQPKIGEEIFNSKIMVNDDNYFGLKDTEKVIKTYMQGSLNYTDYIDYLDELVVQYYLIDYIHYPIVIYILKCIVSKLKGEQKKTAAEKLLSYNSGLKTNS